MNDRIKAKEIKVSYQYVPQRLDLIQVDGSGKLSIKKRTSVPVCPRLPDPDPGCTGLAGVHIATFDNFAISREDICVIDPAPRVEPINAKALAKTIAKLKAGKPVKVGIFGASTTLGAEAGNWWKDASLTYRGRLIAGLKKEYGAEVTEIGAYKGGITVKKGAELFKKNILPQKPDVMTIHYGLNDASGPLNGEPKNPPPAFKEDVRAIIRAVKENGTEVLIITPYRTHPAFQTYDRVPVYRDTLLSLVKEEDVACADFYAEWENQRTLGIPPYTLLHNNHNHPGVDGHKLMADAILRCFGVE